MDSRFIQKIPENMENVKSSVGGEEKKKKRKRKGTNSDTLKLEAPLPASKMESSNVPLKKPGTKSKGRNVIIQKDDSQQVNQEELLEVLEIPESKSSKKRKSRKKQSSKNVKKPPPEGLNEFGYFDYSHNGLLKTPITPAHAEFMEDSGIIAMDCEMVGVGPEKESALARVSIVNQYGFCIYDKFVKPELDITDYRTERSGIRENDLKDADPFQTVKNEVSGIMRDHILIGHSLEYDRAVLHLTHPKAKTRDTALFFSKRLRKPRTPSLKTLAKELIGIDIQQGEHSSITDAQAAMALYQRYQKDWEHSVQQSNEGKDILKITLDKFKEMKCGI